MRAMIENIQSRYGGMLFVEMRMRLRLRMRLEIGAGKEWAFDSFFGIVLFYLGDVINIKGYAIFRIGQLMVNQEAL